MKRLNPLYISFFIALPLFLTGCSSKPIDELEMARTAMDEARSSEAMEYAPNDWDRARTAWEEANALIQMGRYGEARDTLTVAVANFNTARDAANRRLESLRIEIDALKSSIETELNKLEQAAESAKVKPSVRNIIDGSLPLMEEKVTEMNAAFEEKEYLRARMTGKEVLDWLRDFQERVAPTS